MRRRAAITFVAVATVRLPCRRGLGGRTLQAVAPGSPLLCAQIAVPLDRSGAVPGTIDLHVERLLARGTARRGRCSRSRAGRASLPRPYSSTGPFTFRSALGTVTSWCSTSAAPGCPARCAARQLIVPARRTPVEQADRPPSAVRSRSARRRAFYTTRDSVDDIDAVRQALGVEKITLFGVSYGTKVALGYAAKYPQHVERLVLDSVVELTGPGAFSEESLAACRESSAPCARVDARTSRRTPSQTSPRSCSDAQRACCTGHLVAADGRASAPGSAGCGSSSCCSPETSTRLCARELPAALCARARGRHGPVAAARAAQRARRRARPRPIPQRRAVHGDVCEEGPLPWDRTTPVVHGPRLPKRTLRALPAAVLGAVRPHDGAVRLAHRPALQPLAHGAGGAAVARRPLPGRPHAGAFGRGRPAHAARVGAPHAARIPGATLIIGPGDGSLGARAGSRAAAACGPRTTSSAAGRCGRARRAGGRSLPAALPALAGEVPPEPQVGGRRGPHGHRGRPHAGGRAGPALLSASLLARSSRTSCASAACAQGTCAPGDGRSSCTASCSCRACACVAASSSATAPRSAARDRTRRCARPPRVPPRRVGHRPARRAAGARRTAGPPRRPRARAVRSRLIARRHRLPGSCRGLVAARPQ